MFILIIVLSDLSYRFVDLRPELVKSIESDATLEMTQEYDEIDTIGQSLRAYNYF